MYIKEELETINDACLAANEQGRRDGYKQGQEDLLNEMMAEFANFSHERVLWRKFAERRGIALKEGNGG